MSLSCGPERCVVPSSTFSFWRKERAISVGLTRECGVNTAGVLIPVLKSHLSWGSCSAIEGCPGVIKATELTLSSIAQKMAVFLEVFALSLSWVLFKQFFFLQATLVKF